MLRTKQTKTFLLSEFSNDQSFQRLRKTNDTKLQTELYHFYYLLLIFIYSSSTTETIPPSLCQRKQAEGWSLLQVSTLDQFNGIRWHEGRRAICIHPYQAFNFGQLINDYCDGLRRHSFSSLCSACLKATFYFLNSAQQ